MSKKKIKKNICNLRKNRVFGKLRVVERLENELKPNGWLVDRYLVMCSCGCCFPITGPTLTSGFKDRCDYCAGKLERCS
jgi:hypothetical protein